MNLDLVSIIVDDYDAAIAWFKDVLGFALVEDVPSFTNDGRTKRWVIVRPPGAQTGLLLAKADGDVQRAAIGAQFAGRVGLFLRVDDFEATLARLRAANSEIVGEPRDEAYGRVVVFRDRWGNKWDLLGPRPT
jgi:catechol 2,3-dioxygenase-like lactoylglutathione lyase family enzyme